MAKTINNTIKVSSYINKRRNWLSYIFIGLIIVIFAIIIEKEIELPAVILFLIGFFSLAFIFSKTLNKPEVILYALVTYLPFSKVLVGDFGGVMTALNLTNILTIIAIIAWVISSFVQNRRFYRRTSLDILLFIFILFGCLSLVKGTIYFGSNYFIEYIIPLKRWLTPMFLFFIFFNMIRDKETIKKIVIIMMFVLTIVALMAIYDYIDIAGKVSSLEKSRIGGIAQQPNVLAAFFVYYMFLFAGFMLVYCKNIKYWLLFLPFLACFRGIQVTFSRGGYLAFVAAGLIIAFFKNKVLFFAITCALILAILNPIFLPKGIRYRIYSTFQDKIYESSVEESVDLSAARRIEIWKGGLEMIKEHKWFGVGYGVFPYLIPFYAPEVGKVDAHNTYILIAAEMGIFALLVFLLILFIIFKNTYKLYNITKDKFFKALSLGWLGGLGGVLVANIFGGRMDSQEVSSYFWIISALIFRALYIERNSKKSPVASHRSHNA